MPTNQYLLQLSAVLTNERNADTTNQCCGSKYIEFGSGSRILAQFGSRVILSILKEKIQNIFREKQIFLKQVPVYFLNYKHILVLSHKEIFYQLSL